MKTKPCYLVISTETRRVRQVRQSWPTLEPGDITVRVVFDIPDERLPSIENITLDPADFDMRLAVEGEPLDLT